jgi:hypothetical protein
MRTVQGARSTNGRVESLLAEIGRLVVERQALRTDGASRVELERNRLRIAASQQELSHALIERYAPSRDEAAA